MSLSLVLGVCATLLGEGAAKSVPAPAPAAATAPAAQAPAAPAPGAPPARVVDVNASEPPPSSYDLAQRAEGSSPAEGRTLLGQIWRTLLSLLLVVAIIYGLGRLALWRLGRGRAPGGPGLRVVERLALDNRHSLFVVEVSGKQRYLLGTGSDKGVSLIAVLDGAGATSAGDGFADVLASRAAAPRDAGTGDREGSS